VTAASKPITSRSSTTSRTQLRPDRHLGVGAHHKRSSSIRTLAADVEYRPTADPTAVEGSRERRLAAYRDMRDQLMAHPCPLLAPARGE
jgi:hypothetical protein